ncbi:uncharacterized protein (DUF2147 family) [Rhodovulum bhavnagarense]|uniref:Uncharacterized protein (DUF2147 family) n=1 Tax=Rhodovulum bhavnagarense TaxID=992286 RepID=A0A4R2RFX0_9RHOB|nr:DUF2147 domain-containing protein [Rhodovulum bhavnagarense]TCP61584.1 uncharacterized protein (DUF2147 family) [Rhodovulum bhavnagarense]
MHLAAPVFALAALAASGLYAEGLEDVTGHWRTVRHGALVRITDCGDSSPCGRLAWVAPAIAEGNTHDIRNPDAALRRRPLIGVPILWGFTPDGQGWTGGHLYNPDDGKTFRAHLHLLSPRALHVTGCLGPLCRSQVWTRADAP